jgi:hypothetical protein
MEPNTRSGSSIVPQQSLFLMNSPFIIDIVRRILERAEIKTAAAKGRKEDVIRAVYQVVFQRTPSQLELQKAEHFVQIEGARQKEVEQEQIQSLKAAQKRAEEILETEKSKTRTVARAAVLNEGSLVKRSALTPWETWVQALLFSNEATYLN